MSDKNPLVSVIIATFNTGELLIQTINSILSQTYENMEVIIVDDASTDNTRQIIDSFSSPKIKKIFLEENGNVCISCNTAFEQASGKYIALIGHDDLWDSQKIEKQVKYMEAHPDTVVCFTEINVIDENDNNINHLYKTQDNDSHFPELTQEEWLLILLSSSNPLNAPSALIRKDALDKTGFYKLGLLQTQDYELWIRLLIYGNIYIMPERLISYRRFTSSEKNLSNSSPTSSTREQHEIQYIKYRAIIEMPDKLFANVFSQMLHDVPKTPNETLCEKACVLISFENAFTYKVLMEILEISECRDYLQTKCNFSLTDFYTYNSIPIKFDNIYYDLYLQQNEFLKKHINN